MDMMIDDETSISYQTARETGTVRSAKIAWKKEVSQRRFSREILAKALRDWRKGEHELIVILNQFDFPYLALVSCQVDNVG